MNDSTPAPSVHARLLSMLTARDYQHDVPRDVNVRRYCDARLRRARAIIVLHGLDAALLDAVTTCDEFEVLEARLVTLDTEAGGVLGELPLPEFLAKPQGIAFRGGTS